MNKLSLFLATAFLLSGQLFAQPDWHRLYRDADNRAIDYTSNDEYLLSGHVAPPSIGPWNNQVPAGAGWRNLDRIQLQLLDNTLTTKWYKTYVANDELTAVKNGNCGSLSTEFNLTYAKQVSNGDYIVCGRVRRDGETSSSCAGVPDYANVFLMRVNSNGTPIWYKRYEVGNATALLTSVTETTDGGFMACGTTGGGDVPGLILKTNGGGTLQWVRQIQVPVYWEPSSYLPSGYIQIINYGQDYALLGGTYYMIGGATILSTFVTIISNGGTVLQNVAYDHGSTAVSIGGSSMCVTDDNQLAITGYGSDGVPCTQGYQLLVMKVDPAAGLNPTFVKIYGTNIGDNGYFGTGNGIKCINNHLRICGSDISPSGTGGLYADVDNMTGAINRYAVFNPTYYRSGRFVTANTALGVPVISGVTANPNETFVLKDEYDIDCYATDLSATDRDIPADLFSVEQTPVSVREIQDKAFAFNVPYTEQTICQPPPKMGGRDYEEPQNSVDNTVSISPNRSGSTITVHGAPNQRLAYEISSITGQKIASGEVMSGQSINIADLAVGLYFVRVTTPDGTISIHKLMKE